MPSSSLSRYLAREFGTGDRSRGQSYAQQGMVLEVKVMQGRLLTVVRGSHDEYDVSVDLKQPKSPGALHCTCHRFADGYNCKHLWASILAYESTKLGKQECAEKSAPATRCDPAHKKTKKAPAWQAVLSGKRLVLPNGNGASKKVAEEKPCEKQIAYVIDAWTENGDEDDEQLEVFVVRRVSKADGGWTRWKPMSHSLRQSEIDKQTDRNILRILDSHDRYDDRSEGTFSLRSNRDRKVLQMMIATHRCFWSADEDLEEASLHAIDSAAFTKRFEVRAEIEDAEKTRGTADLRFVMAQSGKAVDEDEIVKVADDGLVLLNDSMAQVANPEAIQLWRNARAVPAVRIRKSERKLFLKELAQAPGAPDVRLPKSWDVDVQRSKPTGLIKLAKSEWGTNFEAQIHFRYGQVEVLANDTSLNRFDAEQRVWVRRNPNAERRLSKALLKSPHVDPTPDDDQFDFLFEPNNLLPVVDEFGANGWEIILLGKRVKHPGDFDIAIESGQDWFDLSADVDFDGESISLPSLLRAMSRKENFVTLADGSQGRIPNHLIEKYAKVAQFGKVEDDNIRFHPSQAMLLDAMLETKKGVRIDKEFKLFCKKLKSFNGVKPKKPPRGFEGELREYQQNGLGWLHFLRKFGFGGCLADDMGLGKTVQVLALLESRRTRRIEEAPKRNGSDQFQRKPSIVVVPKSLVFNWIDEAAKFTPRLRFLNYTGTGRKARAADSDGFDVMVTTYGTMRKDIAELSEVDFDYAILDESQAIKNAKAQCAKASRLLNADHRLAMTGTPIENHLGELWSLFEFLNPGMLGASSKFASLTRQKKGKEHERKKTLDALSKSLQPYLLRRTKEQVLTDLPPKTEQTLYCDMSPSQKKKYDELKKFYRVKLIKKVATDGMGCAKIQVLEALLRLRQVACDPRLLDEKAKPGAKLEFMHQQLGEVVAEGHKVLVFSQFTSLLSLVRDQFDADGVCYEYLDGATRNRKAAVKRFQENPDVSVFLISLKAGGHGLNLTAADYVYLLDPWWNPAVEAQAVDRAHRMGQERPVIAYRMICRDTVEEKIIELKQAKQDLAESVIRSDESLIRTMTAEDLSLLLG